MFQCTPSGSQDKPVVWQVDPAVGLLVWGKLKSAPWWPGIIVSNYDCGLKPPKASTTWIYWFGDHRVSEVLISNIQPFAENFSNYYDKKNKSRSLHKGIHEAIQLYAAKKGESDSEFWILDHALQWMESLPPQEFKRNIRTSVIDGDLFDSIRQKLSKVKATNLEHQAEEKKNKFEEAVKKEVKEKVQEEVIKLKQKRKRREPDIQVMDSTQRLAYRSTVFDKVKDKELNLEEICLSCVRVKTNLNQGHPYFKGRACDPCFEDMKETTFKVGVDSAFLNCVVCSWSEDMIICDNVCCKRAYCTVCINLFCPKGSEEKIKNTNPWYCFLCSDSDLKSRGYLKKRKDWPAQVAKMYIRSKILDKRPQFEKHPIRVLSLFDGIGTVLCVLKKLDLQIELYYAIEVDQEAILVAEKNHGSSVNHLGSGKEFNTAKLAQLGPFDLLIGGSHSNLFKNMNYSGKRVYDPTGTGTQFFYFYRFLTMLKNNNKGHPLFWLYENVASMSGKARKVTSRFVECDPIVVDSKAFSAQSITRLYWGNIPGIIRSAQTAMEMGVCPVQKKVKSNQWSQEAIDEIRRVTVLSSSVPSKCKVRAIPEFLNGKADTLWVEEIEELFGLPKGYTDIGKLTPTERLRLLGKNRSFSVLYYLLQPLTSLYSLNSDDQAET